MVYHIYFLLLAVLWGTIWAAFYWGLRQRDIVGSFFGRKRQRNFLIVSAVCVAVLFVYSLSYAPFLYFRRSWPTSLRMLDDLYVPLQWAIDHTWLRQPLVWWSAIWTVDYELVWASAVRMRNPGMWGTSPQWHYALCWLAFGAVLSVAPPYVLRLMQKKLRSLIIKPSQAALPN